MTTDSEQLARKIGRTLDEVDNLAEKLHTFLDSELDQIGRSEVAAVYVADRMARTYTAMEVLFIDISRYFENDEPVGESWHAELLLRMKARMGGSRESVLSDESIRLLDELRRFRHITRHNYRIDYDWTQLDDRCSDYLELIPLVKRDLARFRAFLKRSPP